MLTGKIFFQKEFEKRDREKHFLEDCLLFILLSSIVDLCYELCSSGGRPEGQSACWPARWPGCLAILHGIIFQHFFIPAMLIGTIDFYHFVPFSLTLNLAGDQNVHIKQNLFGSVSCTFFS